MIWLLSIWCLLNLTIYITVIIVSKPGFIFVILLYSPYANGLAPDDLAFIDVISRDLQSILHSHNVFH